MVEQPHPSGSSLEDLIEVSNSMTKSRTRFWMRAAADVMIIPKAWLKWKVDYIELGKEDKKRLWDLINKYTRKKETAEMEIEEKRKSGEWADMDKDEKEMFKFSESGVNNEEISWVRTLILEGSHTASERSEKRTDILVENAGNHHDNGGGK